MSHNDKLSKFYGYIPTLWICILFLVLFSISIVAHIIQAKRYQRKYFLYSAVIACSIEILGWAARAWSHFVPQRIVPYLIQTIATINAPTFLIAAYFVTLGHIINKLGPEYSRLEPKYYTIVFLAVDIVALTVQGIGGSLASVAAVANKSPNTGGTVMLVGIVFQLIAIIAFMFLALEFLVHFLNQNPFKGRDYNKIVDLDADMKTMLVALGVGAVCLVIRSIYRVVELTHGFNGVIIGTELYFNLFDGAMVILASMLLNFFHPGRMFEYFSDIKTSYNITSRQTAEEHPLDVNDRYIV